MTSVSGCILHASVVAAVVRVPRSEVTLHVIGREAGCGWSPRVVWKFCRARACPPQGGGIGGRRTKTLALGRTEGPQVQVIVEHYFFLRNIIVVAPGARHPRFLSHLSAGPLSGGRLASTERFAPDPAVLLFCVSHHSDYTFQKKCCRL